MTKKTSYQTSPVPSLDSNKEGSQASQQAPHQPATYSNTEINLIDLWKLILNRKYTVIGLTALFTTLSVIYVLIATPIYKAEILLAPNSTSQFKQINTISSQLNSLANLSGINSLSSSHDTDEAIAVLKSRQFLSRFINERNLLPTLFSSKWDKKNNQWKPHKKSWLEHLHITPPVLDDAPSTLQGYRLFIQKILDISQDKKTGLVTLTIEWSDPELAKQWANQLTHRVNLYLRKQAKAELLKTIDYLKEQVKTTSLVDAQAVIFRLIEEQVKAIMFANARDEYAFRVIDPAITPDKPFKPKKLLIVILGLFSGLVFSILLIIMSRSPRQNAP